MRQIGQLDDELQADRFAAYLLTQGVESIAEPEGAKWVIWIRNENQVDVARTELAAFQKSPTDPQYLEAQGRAQEILREEQERQKKAAKNVVSMQGRWRNPSASGGGISVKPGPCVIVLILLSVGVTIVSGFGTLSPGRGATAVKVTRAVMFLDPIHQLGAAWQRNPDSLNVRLTDIRQGEVWRLATPMFLHLSVLHLVFNMMWLFSLGSQIESRYGTLFIVIMVLGLAIGSMLVQCLMPLAWDGSPFVGGMSGVVYGLFGFVWIKSRIDPGSGLFVSPINQFLMIGWLFACLTGLMGNVANWAHFAGIGLGIVIALIMTQSQKN